MAEIGKISIRVSPDMKGFHAQVKSALKSVPDEVKVGMQAKTKEFTAKAEAAIKSLPDAKVKVKADTDYFKQRMASELKSALSTIDKRIPLTINGERIRRELKLVELQIQKSLSKPIPFDLSEAARFRREIERQIEGLSKGANRRVLVSLHPDVKMGRFFAAREALKKLFHIPVNIDFNLKSLAKLGAATAAKGIASIGQAALGAVAGLFSFQGAMVLVIAAIAALIPPVLALGAGLVTLAPGLLALIPAAGAIVLGFEGIKKAAENAGLFQDTNGDKKGGGAIGQALEDIQKAVSGAFEEKLTAPFKRLGEMMPQIQPMMVSMADGLSSIATGFIDAISQGPGLESLKNIMSNMGKGMEAAAPGVRAFTEGILDLVSGISNHFKGFGDWFTGLGEKFKAAVADLTKPGEDGFSRLDVLIQNVRAGVGGLTDVFRALWDDGMKNITDPSFGEPMKQFFNAVADFVKNTLPSLVQGFRSLASLMNTLSPLFKLLNIGGNVVQAVTSPKEWFKQAEARINAAAANGKGGFLDALKAGLLETGLPVEDLFADVPKAAARTGQEAGERLVSEAAKAATEAAKTRPLSPQELIDAVKAEQDARAAGAKIGQAAAAGVSQGATGNPANGGDFLGAVLGNVAGKDAPGFADRVQKDMQQAQQAASNAAPDIQGELEKAAAPVEKLPEFIGKAMQTIPQTVADTWTPIIEGTKAGADAVVIAASSTLINLPQIVQGAFNTVNIAATAAWGPVVQSVVVGAQQILVAVSSNLVQLPAIASQAFGGMSVAIQGQMALAVQAVAEAGAQIISTLQSVAGPAVGAGVAVAQGFANGIRSGIGLAVAAAFDLGGAAIAAANAKLGVNSPSREFRDIGNYVGDGFVLGLNDSAPGMVGTIRQILEQVKEVFGNASGLTLNLNLGGGLSSLSSSMSSLATSAKDYSSNLSSAVPSAQILTAEGKKQLADINRQLDELELQRKELKVAKNNAGSKDEAKAIQAQIDAIQAQKDALSLEKDKLDYAKKYGGEVNDAAEAYKQMLQGGAKMPFDFAKANSDQFLSDIGVGGGAITGLMENLAQWAPQAALGSIFNFNVSNTDEAIAISDHQKNKEALQYTGR